MAPTLEVNSKVATIAVGPRGGSGKQVAPSTTINTTGNSSSFRLMLEGICAAFERRDNKVDVDELWQVLESYRSEPDEWAKYAYYDTCKYMRNLVDEHEKYNVMILTWGPNTKSCIHDHSGSHCFMKILDGELIESRFPWPNENQIQLKGEMCPMSESRMTRDDILYINDKVGLHCVENPSNMRTAASLHVYIPPYRECKSFDRRTGKANGCKLSFFSERGKILGENEENGHNNKC